MPKGPLEPLGDLPHRIRQHAAEAPEALRHASRELRADPSALWRFPITRILLLIVLGLLAAAAARWLAGSLTPRSAEPLAEPTPSATLYVACTRDACRHHFSTQQPMDFDDWPLPCPDCGAETVYRARVCDHCRKWFARAPGEPENCPFCEAREQERQARQEPAAPDAPPVGDDAEDPWE